MKISGVYQKNGRYYKVISRPGNKKQWVALSRISEGSGALHRALAALSDNQAREQSAFTVAMRRFLGANLAGLAASEQKDHARMAEHCITAFAEFDASAVQAGDVDTFLKTNFSTQLSSQRRYKSLLSKFFRWCVLHRLRIDNPCDHVRLKTPPKRDRYITDVEFHAIRDALMIGLDGLETRSGAMIQCFVDLCYLTAQRSTDIRLLKWSDVQSDTIKIKPTKTEGSSGASVEIPITPHIRQVLERARSIGTINGMYVIHMLNGSGYTANGVRCAWQRACARAGVKGATIKDIRPKRATDAKRLGYSMEQLQDALAHGDVSTTQGYIKQRTGTVNMLDFGLPDRQKTDKS